MKTYVIPQKEGKIGVLSVTFSVYLYRFLNDFLLLGSVFQISSWCNYSVSNFSKFA